MAYDEAQLTLPVASGTMPGANVNGQCARTTSKTVTALVFDVVPLPGNSIVVCNIPFTIRANASNGRVWLQASTKLCANSSGSNVACSVFDGWVDISGGYQAAMKLPAPPEETNTLALLLRANGAQVGDLVGRNYPEQGAQAPLPGLRQGVVRVRPPNGYPAAGDYLKRLQRSPGSPEAQSERYVYVDFESKEARERAWVLLTKDEAIETVSVVTIEAMEGDGEPGGGRKAAGEGVAFTKSGGSGSQDFLDLLDLPQAWGRAGGWGLVGVLDNGLSTNHPQLRSFTGAGSVGGNRVAGGNYLPFLSRNVGGRSQPINNLEEFQPSAVFYPIDENCDAMDGADDGQLNYPYAGHGTHVSGLVGANGLDGTSVRGACVNCGLASVRRSWTYCVQDGAVYTRKIGVTADVDGEGLEHLYKIGAQVINMSYSTTQDPCWQASNNRVCKAITQAYRNDILMVASAGNARTALGFPANDLRVASVGGLGTSNNFWDESSGSTTFCPNGNDFECGSNFGSNQFVQSRQEAVSPAKSVRSTMYPGVTWSQKFKCGDEFGDGPANDGEGTCTGTSMSAPELAGMYGLLRSINPLMRVGDPVNLINPPAIDGIREVVAETANRSAEGLGEDKKLGFGYPNAELAVQRILGKVRGTMVRNRVTPLFGMYSPGSKDYAAFATPQLAMAHLLYSTTPTALSRLPETTSSLLRTCRATATSRTPMPARREHVRWC